MSGETSARDSFSSLDEQAAEEPAYPVGAVHSCAGPKKARLRVVLRDAGFGVEEGKQYKLTVGDELFEGKTGSDGLVDHVVPASSTAAKLQVWLSDEDGALPVTWNLELGTLDPVSVDPGAQARLGNLGFKTDESGIKEFKVLFALGEGAELDEASRKRLDEVYQTPEDESAADGVWRPKKTRLFKPSKTRAADPAVGGVGDE
jgi:hypothetical protein